MRVEHRNGRSASLSWNPTHGEATDIEARRRGDFIHLRSTDGLDKEIYSSRHKIQIFNNSNGDETTLSWSGNTVKVETLEGEILQMRSSGLSTRIRTGDSLEETEIRHSGKSTKIDPPGEENTTRIRS